MLEDDHLCRTEFGSSLRTILGGYQNPGAMSYVIQGNITGEVEFDTPIVLPNRFGMALHPLFGALLLRKVSASY